MKKLFSIIIPVYNENSKLNKLIKKIMLYAKNYNFEIIVVNCDKNDTGFLINDKRIISIIAEKGRALQMNEGARKAKGSILIFLHADTMLPENAFSEIRITIMEKAKAGAFNLGIDSKNIFLKIIENVSSIRSRITRIPYGDQCQFYDKNYFFDLGGFPEIPLMEDVEIMRKIKKRKDKIFIIPAKVKTSARKWKSEGIIKCTLKNWLLITLYFLGVNPDKLVKIYYR